MRGPGRVIWSGGLAVARLGSLAIIWLLAVVRLLSVAGLLLGLGVAALLPVSRLLLAIARLRLAIAALLPITALLAIAGLRLRLTIAALLAIARLLTVVRRLLAVGGLVEGGARRGLRPRRGPAVHWRIIAGWPGGRGRRVARGRGGRGCAG